MSTPMRMAAACALAALISIWAQVAPLRAADAVATPDNAAVFPLPVSPRSGGPVYLDVRISAFTPPKRGAVDAVVTLDAGAGREAEIGRIAVFAAVAFVAKEGEPGRSYRFNVTAALAAFNATGGALMLRIHLLPIDAAIPIDGAQMTIGGAEFRTAS